MHPAYSVIFFTTSSGAGYGLLALLGLMGALGIAPVSLSFAIISMLIALTMITFGLLASTFHLGHPERAWRALSQWQTSWLSREGVLAIITYPIALIFGVTWSGLIALPVSISLFGAMSAVFAMLTVFSTGQIYATLKTIRAWNQPLTTPIYLIFSVASGASLLNALQTLFAANTNLIATVAGVASCVLMTAKILYWRAIDQAPRNFTMADATGLKGQVRQWETPHTQKNYVQREMGFVVARRHAERLRVVTLSLVLIAGIAAAATVLMPSLAGVGFLAMAIAAVFERWMFFAEAEHVVTLYYGNAQA